MTIVGKIKKKMVPGKIGIPKPVAKPNYEIKDWGQRRGENALIYLIPNHKHPDKPYQKGITENEWEQAYKQIMKTGTFRRLWFNKNMQPCAKEGSCNFTSIGGIFEVLGIAVYEKRGVYRKKGSFKTNFC